MKNFKDAVIGKRIRLLSPLTNSDSSQIPVEKIPVGTEGTIVHVSIHGNQRYDQIGVNWDNGSSLNIFPHTDDYEIFDGEKVHSTVN
jgi:hypothetical protein